jgi:hypothetical protein
LACAAGKQVRATPKENGFCFVFRPFVRTFAMMFNLKQ